MGGIMAKEHEQRRAISRDQVPFLSTILAAGKLSDTAANLLKWEVKAAALRRINAELGELDQERPSFEELRERVHESYGKYYNRAVDRMARYIGRGALSADCFATLEKRADTKTLYVVPWTLVDDALAQLEAAGYVGLPAEEKAAAIASLQKDRQAIIDAMEVLLPAKQFARNDPQSNAAINAAAAFFDSWRQIQIYTTDLCCYRGIALHLADDETQRAHAVLGLSQLRSKSAKVSAHVPPAMVA
jgi:hypothetical protein